VTVRGPAATPLSRADALRAPVLVATLGVAAAALLHVRDPHDTGSYGACPFLSLTGRPCPGCGGLRAVNDLTRGDVVAAVSSNAAVVAGIAAVALLWVVWFVRRVGGRHDARLAPVSTRGAVLVLTAIAAFGVLRLTPWGSWLAP
jgi:hypothetical protein